MASQPLNTDITVLRRVRAQAVVGRHTSVKEQQGYMHGRFIVVPAEEIRVLETKEAVVSDAWRYGHPVVRYARALKDEQTIINGVSNLDMPVRLTVDHREYKLQKTAAAAGDDLFGDVVNA